MNKKLMLIGQSECGKTSLVQALMNQPLEYRKTQMLDFSCTAIDTPGEYLENPRFYPALINTSYDADIIALVQSADNHQSLFAPLFAQVFNKPVIGIVTKTDISDETGLKKATNFLSLAGVNEVYSTSAFENLGIETLREMLA